MKRFFSACLVAFLALSLTLALGAAVTHADGYIITESLDPSSVMSSQKAVIIHNEGHQDLIISVGLKLQPSQHPEDWAWIIPVPSQPEVNAIQYHIFRVLDIISMPEIVWKAVDEMERPVTMSEEDLGSVEVLERKQVGVLDVAVLSGDRAATLLDWLEAEGFHVPRSLVDPIDAYIADGWTFVAMRISPYASEYEIQDAQPVWLSFDAPEMVYPMRLTGAHGNPLALRLYILADHRYELDGFEVEFAGPAELGMLEQNLAPVLEGEHFFTKLYNPTVAPEEMVVDFYPYQARSDKHFRQTEIRTYHSGDAHRSPSTPRITVTTCGLCWLLLALLLMLLLTAIWLLRRRAKDQGA